MATRHQVLSTTEKLVKGLITQLTPDPETACRKAFELLGPMVKKSRAMTASDVDSDFSQGIQAVIRELDAFGTGFARTFEQENGGVAKAAGFEPITKEMTLAEFAAFASTTIRKALKCVEQGFVGRALEALHTLDNDIRKAVSFEDTTVSSIKVTVENDPMRASETESPGTMAPAGTSAGSTAASNYVTNPTATTAPAPVTTANPSTGSMQSLPASTPAGASTFVAKTDETPAEPVVPAPTPEDVAKADDAAIAKRFEDLKDTLEHADPNARLSDAGWCSDLSSPEFMQGKTRERF